MSRAATDYRYEKLTWPEINEAAEAEKVLLLPIGSTEQHGHHLPLDVDNFLATNVCLEAAKKAPRELDAGKGWESIIRLGAEQKSLGDSIYLSFKTQCQQAMEELTIPYSLQGAGAKQLVNIKPVRVSKGGKKGKDNTKTADKDKPSQNAVSTWLSNIQAGLKEHEIEELAFELADSLAPVSQLALLKHLAKNNEYAVEVEQFKKAS